ncbi:MAG: hypothetical protein H7145_01670 [Akkermansiaceae bacterium]|nr:hypothetical protein [Armatimonadota bacterium]
MPSLKPKIKEEWRATVPAKSFWIAVLAVAVPLCIVGFYTIETGQVPKIPPTFHLALLVVLGVIVVYQLFKFGRRAFPFPRIIHLLGFTLLSSSILMAPGTPGKSVLDAAGSMFLGISVLLMLFRFGKRDDASAPAPSND